MPESTDVTPGADKGRIVIHVKDAPPPRPRGECPVTNGPHRWAYLTRGGQACGYCGRPR